MVRRGKDTRRERRDADVLVVPLVTSEEGWEEVAQFHSLLGGPGYEEHLDFVDAGLREEAGALLLPLESSDLVPHLEEHGGSAEETLRCEVEHGDPVRWEGGAREYLEYAAEAEEEFSGFDMALWEAVERADPKGEVGQRAAEVFESIAEHVQGVVEEHRSEVWAYVEGEWDGETFVEFWDMETLSQNPELVLTLALCGRGRITLYVKDLRGSALFTGDAVEVFAWEVGEGRVQPLPASEVQLGEIRDAEGQALLRDAFTLERVG